MSEAGLSGTQRPSTELIVVVRADAGVRVARGEVTAAAADVGALVPVLRDTDATMAPLFGAGEERLRRRAAQSTVTGIPVPDLSRYYRIRTSAGLEELGNRVRQLEFVEAAYVAPSPEPAQSRTGRAQAAAEAPPATPDFTSMQGYLGRVPGGVDARYAWTLPGGEGEGVGVIDVAGGWNFTHEALRRGNGGVVGGQDNPDWVDQGTAVVGVIGADRNAFGITGICPRAFVRAVSIFGPVASGAEAIRLAADASAVGDVILVDLSARHPVNDTIIPVEWWPEYFDAVRYATSQGVIVLSVAGDGGHDLDDVLYDDPGPGFPSDWRNPFRRDSADSGSIVVGAGASPFGAAPDRSRLSLSNYGSAIDAQGWGERVTTSGYGDLQGDSDPDLWYTTDFGGTSSALSIVAGAVVCLQGVAQAQGWRRLTPASIRRLLRAGGSPQQDASGRPATEHIGNRPDLRDLVGRLTKENIKDTKDKEREGLIKTKEKEKEKEGKLEKRPLKESMDKPIKEKEKDKEKELDNDKDIKDLLDKPKEVKEQKEKESVKELKEKEKEQKEKESEGPSGPQPQGGSSLEERVSRVEGAVTRLVHFIDAGLRPELGHSSLASEIDVSPGDLDTLRREQEAAERNAKQVKDMTDIGKLREA